MTRPQLDQIMAAMFEVVAGAAATLRQEMKAEAATLRQERETELATLRQRVAELETMVGDLSQPRVVGGRR